MKEEERENIKKIVMSYFQNIESDTKAELTPNIKNIELFNELIEAFVERDKLKLKANFDSLIDLLDGFKENDATESDKEIVKGLVDDLYKYTDNKGVENNLWKYMNHIMFIGKVSEDLEKIDSLNLNKETKYYLFLSLYISLYELILHHLTEICILIAKRKRTVSRDSERLINVFEKKNKAGMTLFRGDIIQFLKKEKYIKPGKKFFLSDSILRDKPAHALAYYDISKDKLIIGENEFNPKILFEKFKEILDFTTYLLSYIMQKTNTIEGLKNMRDMFLER